MRNRNKTSGIRQCIQYTRLETSKTADSTARYDKKHAETGRQGDCGAPLAGLVEREVDHVVLVEDRLRAGFLPFSLDPLGRSTSLFRVRVALARIVAYGRER